MRCPFCHSEELQVLDTRDTGVAVRRRRACRQCAKRFTTYERVERLPLQVVKRDGLTEPFDREKLLRGLMRAAVKRPVTGDQLEELVERIESEAASEGEAVPAERIGELALAFLRELDAVAYVRFASVYRKFSGPEEFERELERLQLIETPVRKIQEEPLPPSDKKVIIGSSPRKADLGG